MFSYFNSRDKLVSTAPKSDLTSLAQKTSHQSLRDKFTSNDKENIEVNNLKGTRNPNPEDTLKRTSTSKAQDSEQVEVKSTAHQLYVNHFWNFTIMQAELDD